VQLSLLIYVLIQAQIEAAYLDLCAIGPHLKERDFNEDIAELVGRDREYCGLVEVDIG